MQEKNHLVEGKRERRMRNDEDYFRRPFNPRPKQGICTLKTTRCERTEGASGAGVKCSHDARQIKDKRGTLRFLGLKTADKLTEISLRTVCKYTPT